MDIGRKFIRDQGTESVPQYRARVYRLAAIYVGITLCTTAAIVLIVLHGTFYITLSQRSNVETLTIAFILVLFTYLGLLSLPGAWGALRIVWFNLPAWLGRNRAAVERRKQAALKRKQGMPSSAFLNRLVRLHDDAATPIHIPLRDEAGSMGTIIISGAKLLHAEAMQYGSNSIFAFFAVRLQDLARQHDPQAAVEIVHWTSINDEQARQYESLVTFSENLERSLQSGPLWPAVELTAADVRTLTREGRELCAILRNEAHLPDLEYRVQHQVPIIPQPLGIIALARSEERADPVASMGCALIVVVAVLVLIVLFRFIPPWVPGK